MSNKPYTVQADYCQNCRRFVDIDELQYADYASGLGYSESYFCRECGSGKLKSVPFVLFEMFERQEIEIVF